MNELKDLVLAEVQKQVSAEHNQDSQIGPREIDLQGEIDFERITKAFTRAKIREQERGAWKCFRVAFKFEGKRRSIIYWPALNKISVAYCN